MKQLLLSAFIMALSVTAGAQTRVPTFEEVEKKEQSCADTFPDNAARDCYYALAKQYEIILNDVYKKIMAIATADEKKWITEAEKKWIAYKDADIMLRNNLDTRHGNTGYRLMELFKERTAYLLRLLEGMKSR